MSAAQPYARIDASSARPVVRGTDIKVSQIASEYEHLGSAPDQIVEAHPHLCLADVHAALAYYYDHVEAIREEWRAAEATVAALRRAYPSRVRPPGKVEDLIDHELAGHRVGDDRGRAGLRRRDPRSPRRPLPANRAYRPPPRRATHW
jgi:uncharacterized protein (DUF433 family)